MVKCGQCSNIILFGGVQVRGQRFCNEKCAKRAASRAALELIPEDVIEEALRTLHEGDCPRCSGEGPVNLHHSHRIWSAVVFTSRETRQHLTCRACANKAQLLDTLFCAGLGWWGIPFGLFLTPIQLLRNAISLGASLGPDEPSTRMRTLVAERLNSRSAASSLAD